jgi:hypothetical protein
LEQSAQEHTVTKGNVTMTIDELIAFWSRLNRHTVHPDDDQALLEGNGFETRLIPLPWNGPIKSARAFVAFLNPGLDWGDLPYEQGNSGFCDSLRENLKGRHPYVYFEPEYQNHAGAEWARGTFGPDWPVIASARICIIQLVAYHSVNGKAPSKVFHRLRSTAVMNAWVQHTLLPRVRARDAFLVVGRAVSAFGVGDEPETPNFVRYGGVGYRGREYRRALMRTDSRGGDALRRFLSWPPGGF